MGDPQDTARERARERAEHVESILAAVDPALDEHAYPTSSAELATEYAHAEVDVGTETETLGDVIDRLATDRFEDATEARDAVLGELAGETPRATFDETDVATDGTEQPTDEGREESGRAGDRVLDGDPTDGEGEPPEHVAEFEEHE